MNLLLDTHLLLWAAYEPGRLSDAARNLMGHADNRLLFSPINLWEVVIKRALGRPDFQIDPRQLRRGLTDNGYFELPVGSNHTLAVDLLPPLHKDPFDRLLVAQALAEGVALVTADRHLAGYPGDIRIV